VREVACVAIRTGGSAAEEPSTNAADGVDLLSVLAISEAEARALSRSEVVERLVESGSSRLTAERIADVEFDAAEIGRARPRTHARR
jgi:hypothetical protein